MNRGFVAFTKFAKSESAATTVPTMRIVSVVAIETMPIEMNSARLHYIQQTIRPCEELQLLGE